LSEPVPIELGVSIEKKGDPVADSAFVGLRVQYFARALVGPRNQLFLPVAILIRAWLLLLADTIGRNILEPEGIPAGMSRRKSTIFVKAEDVFSFFCLPYHLQIFGAAQIGT
jgi:iron complex transport system permease protein